MRSSDQAAGPAAGGVVTSRPVDGRVASGAGVLQLRSVEYARNHGVRIHCRSSFEDGPGTVSGNADEPPILVVDRARPGHGLPPVVGQQRSRPAHLALLVFGIVVCHFVFLEHWFWGRRGASPDEPFLRIHRRGK